ncbi:MAG: cytochrome c biogenesis CcdA family protein, partial [Planctomycetota bacterium]
LLASFLLGLISSIACACCTFPILGAVIGYSGSRKGRGWQAALLAGLFFMFGVIIATVILGSIVGFMSEVAQVKLGRYWKLLGGFIIIFFGLGTLRLLPFKFPKKKIPEGKSRPTGLLPAALFGLVIGGGIGFCSLPCNPGIFIVLGAAVVQGYNLRTVMMLIVYAIGFSLPLAAIMLGVSFGKSVARAKKTVAAIRIVAGIVLIAAGFYLLATI